MSFFTQPLERTSSSLQSTQQDARLLSLEPGEGHSHRSYGQFAGHCSSERNHALGVRHVRCSPVFPSVPSLRSADSAPLPQRSTSAISGLFAGLFATMEGSDFSCSFFIGFDSSSSRHGPLYKQLKRPSRRSPGSRAKSVPTCQGLRPRRAEKVLALSRLSVLPSATLTASAP